MCPFVFEQGLTSAGGGLVDLSASGGWASVLGCHIKLSTSVVQAWYKQLHCKHDEIRLNHLPSASSEMIMFICLVSVVIHL